MRIDSLSSEPSGAEKSHTAVKRLALLGSTGSIGVSTLDVVAAHPDRFQVVALAAGGQGARVVEQARRFRPRLVALREKEAAEQVREALTGTGIRVVYGPEGVMEAAALPEADMTVSAIVGAAGLEPTLAAIRAGKDIALANKECLVTAGALFMDEVKRRGVRLVPVDSEHSAIFQVMWGGRPPERIQLTASGGPFRGWRREQLEHATLEQALAHPSWSMGRKITIDSATMMNKGLEVIEARWLFDMPPERIEVIIHPESIVHSMIAYGDGSVLAQMGTPDMRTPIAVALAWPDRISAPVSPLDLAALGKLHFYPAPAAEDFPCLNLAYQALRQGGTGSAVLNAANEVAVAAFLDQRIGFLEIPRVIERTMERLANATPPAGLEEVFAVDSDARRVAESFCQGGGTSPC